MIVIMMMMENFYIEFRVCKVDYCNYFTMNLLMYIYVANLYCIMHDKNI